MTNTSGISMINMYCQKLKLKYPVFDVVKSGSDHKPFYKVDCTFENLAVVGEGLTIKTAKEDASLKLVDVLKIDPNVFSKKDVSFVVEYSLSLSDIWDNVEKECILTITKKKNNNYKEYKKFRIVVIQDEQATFV
jgi:hypothetical protein